MSLFRRDGEIVVDRGVSVMARDGVKLSVNVYRPSNVDGALPVVVSVTPYGKDNTPDRIGMTLMRLSGVRFGRLDCSRWTGFESPDPLFWVRAGYAVVQADVRGMHKSEGNAGFLSDDDARDFADLIEWAAVQPWSNGAVGGEHPVGFLYMRPPGGPHFGRMMIRSASRPIDQNHATVPHRIGLTGYPTGRPLPEAFWGGRRRGVRQDMSAGHDFGLRLPPSVRVR